MDVVEGRGPAPSFVVSLIMRLPDDSMTMALVRGGPEHFGWGNERHLLASIYDAINTNTRATGSFKGKPPKFPEYPRPGDVKTASPVGKPKTVAELFTTMQQRR